MTTREHNPSNSERSSLLARLLLVALISGSFFFVDQWLFSSKKYAALAEADYDESENLTAKYLDRININSALARLCLAASGIICLLIPTRSTLRLDGGLLLLILSFFALAGCSFLWSINRGITSYKLAVLTVFGIAAFGMSRYLRLREWAIVSALVCLCYLSIAIPVEISLGTFDPMGEAYRLSGTSHPNTLAAFCVILCLAAGFFSRRDNMFSPLPFALITVGLVCLWLTKSRTSLAGLVCALAAVRALKARPGQRALLFSGLATAVSVSGLLLSIGGRPAWDQWRSVAAMGRTKELTTLTGRLPLWHELLETIAERPLLGHGYLAYWDSDQVERLSETFGWEIPHGHNMFLDVALDLGWLGLILFLTILLLALLGSARHYLVTRDPGAAFLFGLLVFAVVHGAGESLLKLPTFIAFVLLTALLRFAQTPPVRHTRWPDPTEAHQSEEMASTREGTATKG